MKRVWIVMVLMFALWGCSEAGTVQAECRSDVRCSEGQYCDVALGVCVESRFVLPVDEPPPVPTNQPEENQPEENQPEENQPEENQPEENQPEPGLPTCAGQGQLCDLGTVEQGAFLCVPNAMGDGICAPQCERPGHADTCPMGSYCSDVAGASRPGCVLTECSAHGDCGAGSCIHQDNGYAFCLESGPLSLGATCTTGEGQTQCQQGLFCSAPTGSVGECAPLCNPFGLSPCSDPIDEACTVRWNRTGVCTTYPYLADTLEVFDDCSDVGDWCTDGMQCRAAGSGGLCLQFCRPGEGDCSGVMDGFTSTICDNYWFAGNQALGFCVPPCTSDAACGAGWDCVNQICRLPCPSGDPQVDCCAPGSTSCQYTCDSSGYCA